MSNHTRRPRIVAPPDVVPPESGNPDYDYFAYTGKEQLPDLNAMIVEREKKLFEVRASLLMVEGNPNAGAGALSHASFATLMENQKMQAEARGEKWVQTQVCPCATCEVDRLREAVASLTFGLNKLRALYGQLAGGK